MQSVGRGGNSSAPDGIPVGVVQAQVDKILASPGFVRNERLSRFLRFVVEQHLDGRDEELKESLIGIEVFGRSPGFPKRIPS